MYEHEHKTKDHHPESGGQKSQNCEVIMKTANSSSSQEPQKAKHAELHESIERLDLAVQRAEQLLSRIQGAPVAANPVCAEHYPSLESALNFGAHQIDDRREQLQSLLERIEYALFTTDEKPHE